MRRANNLMNKTMKDTINADQRLQPLRKRRSTIKRAVFTAVAILMFYAIFALTLLTLNQITNV